MEEDLISVLNFLKNGQSPDYVSNAIFGIHKYPSTGSSDDLRIRDIEKELIKRKLVDVIEEGGTNKTINGYYTFNISNEGLKYLNSTNSSPNPFTDINDRIEELRKVVSQSQFSQDEVVITPSNEYDITVKFTSSNNHFFISIDGDKKFYTIIRNPFFRDGTNTLSQIHSWNEILEQFQQWLDDTARQNLSTKKTEPSNASNSKKGYNVFSRAALSLRDRSDVEGVIGVKQLANELSQLINHLSNEQGRMIGIFGKWGRGKTFLLDEIWKILKTDNSYNRVDFHSWKYQDTPAVWAYLYEQFALCYYNTDWCTCFKRRIKLNLARLGASELIWFIISLLISATISFAWGFESKVEFFFRLLGTVGISTVLNLLIIYFRYGRTARGLFQKYYNKKSFSEILGLQAEIQKELITLIKKWTSEKKEKKIILYVEDLDRCSDEKLIQIIDSLRVMLEDEFISRHVIVITAIDERILKRAIRSKYRNSEIGKSKVDEEIKLLDELVIEYIDKLFIAGIKLGNLSAEERDDFFLELTKNERQDFSINKFSHNQIIDKRPFAFNATDRYGREDSLEGEGWDLAIKDGDFVIKDGDIALQNEKGEIKSSEQIEREASIKRNMEISAKIKKLLPEEVELLRSGLNEYNEATPRQIRIFYYRYLLAKNLLITNYQNIGRRNIWIYPDGCRLMIRLLIMYSMSIENYEQLDKHKLRISQTTAPRVKVFLLDNEDADTLEYRELLNVLSMVVAY